MKKVTAQGVGTAVLLACYSLAPQAQSDFAQALSEGEVELNFRLRYEDVGWEGLEDADTLTLRSRLTYTSANLNGFGLKLEVDDVTALGDVDYRTAGNDPDYPGRVIIPDPEGTEVNQAFVSYATGATSAKLGRQRILLDNQRFVGGVGWRQNEQTYDALSVTGKPLVDTDFFYAYVDNVNRIFGEQNPIGDHRQNTHLLNAKYTGLSVGSLTGYAYLIDNESAPALSSDTFGARWLGKVNDRFSYTLEYATQSEAGDNPVAYSADYWLAEAAVSLNPVNLKMGYEVLGSDDGVAGFSTPLATLHAFQGWTDRFLSTPAEGIKDLYASVDGKFGGVNLSLVYHDLSADQGDMSYGQELGFSAAKKIGAFKLLLKYADYQADDFGSDTRKLWLMAEADF